MIINHPHQGKGFGKQAMGLIKKEGKKAGNEKIAFGSFCR